MIKHKYHMKRALVLLALVFSILVSVNTAAADSANLKIEPFMAVPFGATREAVIQAEGYNSSSGWLAYHKIILDASMSVTYQFPYDNIFSEKPDDLSLEAVSVYFHKADLTYDEVLKTNAETIAMIKAQMQNPETISKAYTREDFADGYDGKVFVIKEYIKDKNIAAALNYFWSEDTSMLTASFEFCDLKRSSPRTSGFEVIFNPAQSADSFLSRELEPVFIYDFGLTPNDIKLESGEYSGLLTEEIERYSSVYRYENFVFGIPANLTFGFEHNGADTNWESLSSYSIDFSVSCVTVEEAQAAAKKIIKNLATEISATKGFAYHKLNWSLAGESIRWYCSGEFASPQSNLHVFFTWFEEHGVLNASLVYSAEKLTEEDLKVELEKYEKYRLEPFYSVNGD